MSDAERESVGDLANHKSELTEIDGTAENLLMPSGYKGQERKRHFKVILFPVQSLHLGKHK